MEGAQYLSEALTINKVRKYSSSSDISFDCHSRQVFTTINFDTNKIGDDGVKYLSDALKIGQVK